MLARILFPVGTVCSFKEDSSNMDPKRDIEKLSSSLQTCEPFSVSDVNPSNSSIAHDLSSSEILSCTLNSISLVEISEERDEEENDQVRLNDDVKFNDIVHLSPRKRSARVTKSNQKNASKKAGKGCRKQVVINEMLDSILSSVERKTRSYECRPARSSVWGSVGILKYFANGASKVIKKGSKKSKKARGALGSRTEKNNGFVTGLEVSNGNTSAAVGRIRFKVKLGKEMGQTCLKDAISVAENGPQIVEATGTEANKIPNFSEHNCNEEVLETGGTQRCNEDLKKVVMSSESLDICLNKDLDNSVTGEKSDGFVADNHQGIPSPVDIEGPGVAVDNKCLDSSTPDSEVINLIPEAQINGKEREDFHDVQISSQTCVAPADILSLNWKSYGNPSARDPKVQDRLDRPGLLDKASVAERFGQGEKLGDGLDFSGASILTSTVNFSGNTSSSEGSPGELLLSSEASDRGNIFPCTKKSKGRKHLKNSMPKQGRKIKSEVLESPRNQKGNASRTKGNAAKPVGKKNVKYKAACGEFARTIKDYHDTGYNSLDVLEIDKTGDGNMAQENFDMGVAHIDVPDQCIMPQNAWVCCDECFKWRRIPALLADFINETNDRWTCKENVDKNFADCSVPQEKSNSEINAELGISDASCEEDVFHGDFSPKGSHPNPAGGYEQSSWRLIKSNMFMHRSRKSQTIDEIMVCHCKPPTNGKLGCGDGCLNRMLNIECVKGTCPCGEHCSNQQFQKRKYAKLKWFRCGKKGYGLQLLEDISEGQFLIEYVGEVLDMQAYEARQRDYASKGHKHFYFMTLNGGEVIDACAKGNLGRFINHSCDPNCRTEKWMVNGEVSVGFFALKDLKKGDEVTFDYNYVRVFGAAAKKCVCGSSQCQGFIGGDPRNSDIIVQGDSDDEFPEPVMVYDDGEVDNSLKKLISSTSALDDAKASIANAEQVLICEDKLERSETVVDHLEGTKEPRLGEVLANVDDKTDESANDVHHLEEICRDSGNEKLQISFEVMEKSAEALQPAIQKLKSPSQQDIDSLSTISNPRQAILSSPEASVLTVVKKKKVKNSSHTKKKHRSDKHGDTHASKLSKLVKTSRLSASDKPKNVIEGSATVEGTLNELLDDEGGISKRQDATKGYLKLLLLTAASGDSGSGKAIQSNRELSMILGAILKTQSRSVLVDVINKNGLQMLHNMLKRCRGVFSRIPILRKLLRVLEFLATMEILTKDLINRDPSCAGVESFRESILSLAEHDDKQVHQIARNFRHKWIPWFLRRRLPSHNHWQDSQTRDTVNDNHQTIPTTRSVSVDTVMKESCSTQSRKRKSRWDQPADSNKEPKLQPVEHLETRADDDGANMDEDVPPGFAPPCNASCINKGSDFPCKVEIGYPQGKFMNRLAVSYGIPMPIVQQLGYPETDSLEDWFIAPGIPFQSYPPLPAYSQIRSDMRDHRGNYQPAMSQSDHNPPCTSDSVLNNAELQGTNRCNFQRGRGSQGIGRYFRQQKWNNSRLPPPWKRKQTGRGFMGNDFRNRMCGGRNGSQGGNNMEIDSHYFTQNPQQVTYY